MKIKNITTRVENLGNNRPYTIAFKTVDEVKNAFVKIELENGLFGMGAGNPSEYVTGESFLSMQQKLSEANLSFLVGRDIMEIQLLLVEVAERFSHNPAAQAAVDIALWDAFTQHLKMPLVKFLGQQKKEMPTSITIGIKNVEETIRDAQEYKQAGFHILKIKIGNEVEEDSERLEKLQEMFGNYFTLRVDANQGYTPEQTILFYNKTKHLGIELIEQPLKAKNIEGLRGLPDEIKKIVAADESLLKLPSAIRLAQPPSACGIFNIKLMKCGGITEAKKMADVARAENIPLFWGCNDESRVSIAAALHTAFSCAHTQYIDLDGSFDLSRDIVLGGFTVQDGVMRCTDKAGLGVSEVA